MKKTYSISISGMIFHIEEYAFDKLYRYLEAIKSHFKSFEGKEEVITDIEIRIAEILTKKLNDSKQVINLEDVDEVIRIMGQPADYILESEPFSSSDTRWSDIQPKRLYRDPEQRILGGVCSGIASYFLINPIWIRLIFIILAFSVFGFLLYIILWIVVPEARTTAEKLEMRGQPVNISNMEQSLADEMNQVKDKINGLASKARNSYQSQKFDQGGKFTDGVTSTLKILARIIIVTLGFFFFTLGLLLLLAFLALFFHFPAITFLHHGSIGPFPLYPISDMIFTNHATMAAFSAALLAVIGIPLLMLLWAGIRMIFRLPRIHYLGRISILVWIFFLLLAMFYGFRTAQSFRFQGETIKQVEIPVGRTDTLQIITQTSLPEFGNFYHSGYFHFPEWRLVFAEDNRTFYGIPRLRIYPSTDSSASMRSTARARGEQVEQAEAIAGAITYDWNFNNDTLSFPDNFVIRKEDKWRKQELFVDLFLPTGTVFYLDDDSKGILGNHPNHSRYGMAGNMFVMGQNGPEKLNLP